MRELLGKVTAGDKFLVSELSRLGRSLREALARFEKLIHQERCWLTLT